LYVARLEHSHGTQSRSKRQNIICFIDAAVEHAPHLTIEIINTYSNIKIDTSKHESKFWNMNKKVLEVTASSCRRLPALRKGCVVVGARRVRLRSRSAFIMAFS